MPLPKKSEGAPFGEQSDANDNPGAHTEPTEITIVPWYRIIENVTGFTVGDIVTGGVLETPGVAERLLALGVIELVVPDFSVEATTIPVSE